MRIRSSIGLARVLALVLLSFTPGVFAGAADSQIGVAELRQDLLVIRQTIARTHPDLRHSTDPNALSMAFDSADSSLDHAMTRAEAWQRLALLNPVFADAHLFVGYSNWRGDSQAHLKSGGVLFPFEVHVDAAGEVYVDARLGGSSSNLAGARIIKIDGTDASVMVSNMLAMVHGDTPLFRANLLSQRWWFYHWKMYGAPARYRLELEHGGKTRTLDVAGDSRLPAILGNETFDRQFRLEIRPNGAAVLTVGSFGWPDKNQFLAFTRDAFARIREAGASTLVIDVSANGGGDDEMWLDGLMPYLADKPYRTGSTYKKKVIETNADKGEVAGQVVSGSIGTWYQPQLAHPLHFAGRTYVVIGPSTYSSAILFANVMHDFGFGTLAGAGGAARTSQSGGLRKFELPNTGLALFAPRFVLDPPGGARDSILLEPTIRIRPTSNRPDAVVNALLEGVR